MRFRIDVYTATSTAAVGSPITEVLGIGISEKLNQIGQATITIAAHEAESRGLGRGYRYAIYHEKFGYLGMFKHIESTVDASAETITITAYDSLIALAERVAGFRRSFSNVSFNTVASTVFSAASLGTAWTVSYEGATLTDAITFSIEGENHLRIADYMRQYVRGWFRREGDTAIKFGKFSSTTPTQTFVAFSPIIGDIPTSQSLITQITRTRQGGEVANRIYALGGGIGETKIDLRYSTRAATTSVPYAITSSTIGTGVAGYYIEDTSSQATYGQIDRVVAWNEIRPITNSAADLQNAGNALYDIAAAYLQKYKSENDAYTLTAVNVPSTLRVGDLVRVAYNGVAELETGNVGWLNVANNFFVTDISRSFDASGQGPVTIGIAANGEAVVGDTEVLYDILQDVQTLKLRTQPTQTYFSRVSDTVYTGANAWGSSELPSFYFNIPFGAEVLAINEMYLDITARQWFFANGLPSSASISVTSTNAFQSTSFTSTASTTASTTSSITAYTTSSNTTATNQSSGAHNHTISITGGASLLNNVGVSGSGSPYSWVTNAGIGSATMGGVSTSLDHNHTQDAHSHNVDHKHYLINTGNHSHAASVSFGNASVDDTVTVPKFAIRWQIGASSGYVDTSSGVQYIQSTDGRTPSYTSTVSIPIVGNKPGIQDYGTVRVNITSIVTANDWKTNGLSVWIAWGQGRAAMSINCYGRVTIQPIAV